MRFLVRVLHIFTPKRFAHIWTYETVSYLFFGGLTTVVSVVFFALFHYYFDMSGAMAGAASDVLAIIFAFFPNKIYVFESPSWRSGVLLPELVKFGASRALTYALGILAMWLLVDVLGFHAMLMRILTIVVIHVIGNYVLSKWIVFTKR